LGTAAGVVAPEIWRRTKASKGGFSKVDPRLYDFMNPRTNELSAELVARITESDKLVDKAGLTQILKLLAQKNIFEMTLAADVKAAAQGKAENKVAKAWEATMESARIMPHLTEVLNRATMAIAAHQLGVKQGMEGDALQEFVEKAVTETQFDYSQLNKARFMSERNHQLLKPIFMFMQHPQHVYALFVQSMLLRGQAKTKIVALRESGEWDPDNNPEHKAMLHQARANMQTLTGILTTHLLMGGVQGAMFEPVKWALGLAALAFEAMTGEPPEEIEEYTHRFMTDLFGEDFGEIVTHGLPMALGYNVSGNLSISNLALSSRTYRMTNEDDVRDAMLAAAGPLPSIALNGIKGLNKLAEGDLWGGLANMSPRALRDVFKGISLASNGLTDSNGNVMVDRTDLSPHQLAGQFFGLRSAQVTEAQEDKYAIDSLKRHYATQQSRLRERLWRSRGSISAKAKAVSDIREWNSKHPKELHVSTKIDKRRYENEKSLAEHGAILTDKQKFLEKRGRL
jgi:hypothetical protein